MAKEQAADAKGSPAARKGAARVALSYRALADLHRQIAGVMAAAQKGQAQIGL
jgi:hypothetical protein